MRTLQVNEQAWVTFEDFSRPSGGRVEDPEVIEQCWELLHRELRSVVRPGAASKALLATRALVSARIRESALAGVEEKRLADLVERQRGVIDHLLGWVPPKAKPIGASRLSELVDDLGKYVSSILPDGVVPSVKVVDELEPDTSACHRITVEIPLGDMVTLDQLVTASGEVAKWLADSTTTLEFGSLNLEVEPA